MEANEVISEAEYADIVMTLLNFPFGISSITKLVFITFCVKHESDLSHYYNRKNDFVDVFLRNISLKLSAHYKEIGKIITVINMLCTSSKAIVNGDHIEPCHNLAFKTENSFLDFCASRVPNPISEINRLDAKAIIEEVIRYV